MWGRLGKVLLVALAALAVPAAVGFLGISTATQTGYPARDSRSDTAALSPRTLPRLDPDRPTVAIVLGQDGANVADTLGPYDVFASTRAFNVVTVAPSTDPVTLTDGLDLVPDLSFAELASRLDGPPEVIVVPQIHGSAAAVIAWLRAQHDAHAPLVMGVCVGPQTLADAGLLDGRFATAHWLKLIGLRRSDPEVDWTSGVRFVDDGDIITTAGVLSGIDGALRVVERLVDPRTARRVAGDLHWTGYPVSPIAIPAQRPGPGDVVGLLSAAYRWNRPTTGVLLADGLDEIELAAAFRPYTELSYLARLESVSVDSDAIRSRHGLTILPRSDWASAVPRLDRVLLPGAVSEVAVPDDAPIPVVALHRDGEFPFDGALRDIADRYDVATAQWVAKTLQYPAPDGELDGARWPWVLTAVPLLLGAVGAAGAVLLGRLLGAGRARSPVPEQAEAE